MEKSKSFSKKFYSLNSKDDLKLLSDFKNYRTKIKIECLVCAEIYEVFPDYYIQNKFSCKKCKKVKTIKNKFNKKLSSEYTYTLNSLEYITIKNVVCGYTYEQNTSKSNFELCPQCKDLNMLKFFDKINNNNYMLLSEYCGFSKKIKYQHLDCGTIIENQPNLFMNYTHNCPACYPKRRKTLEEVKKEIYDLVGEEYVLLNTSYNSMGDIGVFKHVSNKCLNSTFEMPISNFVYRNNRCRNCRRKTSEMFKRDVYDIFKSEYIVVGEYKNSKTKVTIKHNSSDCNYSCFKILPGNFYKLKVCPECKKINNISSGELKIKQYLDKENIKYIREYRCLKNENTKKYLPFDFAVFKDNNLICLIEFDGIQHFEQNSFFEKKSSLAYRKKLDSIKTNWCIEKNIKLIRIKYTDIELTDEILKREIP